ncbi:hypothetical protein D9M72_499340 [compost metagenome]
MCLPFEQQQLCAWNAGGYKPRMLFQYKVMLSRHHQRLGRDGAEAFRTDVRFLQQHFHQADNHRICILLGLHLFQVLGDLLEYLFIQRLVRRVEVGPHSNQLLDIIWVFACQQQPRIASVAPAHEAYLFQMQRVQQHLHVVGKLIVGKIVCCRV